jgi:hypothetical protein
VQRSELLEETNNWKVLAIFNYEFTGRFVLASSVRMAANKKRILLSIVQQCLQETKQRLEEALSQDDTSIPKLQQRIKELEERLAKYERQGIEASHLVTPLISYGSDGFKPYQNAKPSQTAAAAAVLSNKRMRRLRALFLVHKKTSRCQHNPNDP